MQIFDAKLLLFWTKRFNDYTKEITPGQVEEEIAELNALIEELEEGILGNIAKAAGKTVAKGVKVGGITNTLIYFPKCCSPIPGDEIIGYVTRGKGVTIHRSNCSIVPISKEKERFIDVEWEVNRDSSFLVRLKIVFEDRKHLFKNLTESTSLMDINIKSVDIKEKDGMAVCYMVIEVKDSKQLKSLKNAIIKAVQPQSIERV